jgi:hypothetical protein
MSYTHRSSPLSATSCDKNGAIRTIDFRMQIQILTNTSTSRARSHTHTHTKTNTSTHAHDTFNYDTPVSEGLRQADTYAQSSRPPWRSDTCGEEEWGVVRSGPGAAGTILLFHTISARPSKQPRMVGSTLGVYRFGG